MFEQLKKRVPERIGSENIKQFAVMIPLIRKEDGFHILFEVRSSKLAHQPGEICFPGGKQEGGESALETAVRETKEELLLNGENIRVYGALDYVLTGSNRRIDACLGELLHYQGQYSESEVASVFMVPLSFFWKQKPERYQNEMRIHLTEDFPLEKIPNGKDYPWTKGNHEVLFYEYEGYIIWGLTAKLLYYNLPLICGEKI